MRKVAGGGTAGGDRWEGEDEDEDVKVGAGRGARRLGRRCLRAGGRAGRLRGPRAPPGPAGRGSRVSVGPAVPRFPWLAGHVGCVRPDSAEDGGGPSPSPSPRVRSGPVA